jgi:alpha-L-rhamnosidase
MNSESFSVDPAFSKDTISPNSSNLSLFSHKRVPPYWLYHWGDLESYIMKRMRHEAFFTCINVSHPGYFKSFHSVLFLKHQFTLSQFPKDFKLTLYFSGIIDLRINDQRVLPRYEAQKPCKYIIDTSPFLKEKKNTISVRVHRIDEPPTFLAESTFLQTDSLWQISYDSQNWHAPVCYPFENQTHFPHQEKLPQKTISCQEIEKGLYDFKREILGYPIIETLNEGNANFFVGESLPEVRNSNKEYFEQNVQSMNLVAGENTTAESFAFRYLRIDTPSSFKITSVKAKASFYPTLYRGSFKCSDDVLNQIWISSAYTLRLCMQELLVDGIKRDRVPWGGDLFLGNLCNAFSFAEPSIIARTMTALYPQTPEISDVSGIADYTLYWILALRDYVHFYGDLDYLVHVKHWLSQLLQILAAKEDTNGLLPSDKFSWIFIDWATVDHLGYSACIQMLYIMALEAACFLYKLLNDQDQFEIMYQKCERLKLTCQKYFWNSTQNAFVDNWQNGQQGDHKSRHSNILAILSNTAKDNQKEYLLKNILLNKNIESVGTPYMKALECRALAQCGQMQSMISIISSYWGGMLKKGAITFWEAYEKSDKESEQYSFYDRPFGKSLCHAWSAGPIFLLSLDLFGINCLEPGWKQFSISPISNGLEWANVIIPTPHSAIHISQKKNRYIVAVPPNIHLEDRINNKVYKGPGEAIIEL